jgi:hypothetical protein
MSVMIDKKQYRKEHVKEYHVCGDGKLEGVIG